MAKAVYQGEFTKASYELNMSYNKMHNITKKDLVHTVNNEQEGYVLDYNFDNELHPNGPSSIQESGTQPTAKRQEPTFTTVTEIQQVILRKRALEK